MGSNTQNIKFAANGNIGYSLSGGENYDGTTDITAGGALTASFGRFIFWIWFV